MRELVAVLPIGSQQSLRGWRGESAGLGERGEGNQAMVSAKSLRVRVVGVEGENRARENEAYACAPIVATLPQSSSHAGQDSGLKVEMFASRDSLQKEDYYVAAKTSKESGGLQLVGSSLGANLQRPARYVVGLLDRREGTLEVVKPLHHAAVAHLRVWRGAGADGEGEGTAEGYSDLDSRRTLLKEFGSNKIRRLISKREQRNLDEAFVDNQDAMFKYAKERADAAKEKGLDEASQIASMEQARRALLPPHDLGATTALWAYPLGDFVSAEAWQSLKNTQYYRDIRAGGEGCGDFVRKRFERSVSEEASAKDVLTKDEVSKALCLYAVLKWLYTAHPRGIRCKGGADARALAAELDLPERFVGDAVVRFFSAVPSEGDRDAERFGEVSRWECSKANRISLQFHLMVLILMLENFEPKCAVLAAELDIPVPKAKELAKDLGCTLGKENRACLLKGKRKAAAAGEDSDEEDEDEADLAAALPKSRLKRVRGR